MPAYYPDYEDDPPTVELPVLEFHGPVLPEAPRQICHRCRAISHTFDDFCPECATPYSGRTPAQQRLRSLAMAVLIIAGLIAAGAMIAVYNNEVASGASEQAYSPLLHRMYWSLS